MNAPGGWLSGCVTAGSEGGDRVCPPVVEYGSTEQNEAASEVDGLSEDAVIVQMLSDYGVMREQVQACK